MKGEGREARTTTHVVAEALYRIAAPLPFSLSSRESPSQVIPPQGPHQIDLDRHESGKLLLNKSQPHEISPRIPHRDRLEPAEQDAIDRDQDRGRPQKLVSKPYESVHSAEWI